MTFIIIAVVAALICVASLIYGPRIKDSSSVQFKACVATSAVTLLLAAGCGFIAYTTFDMGDPDAVQQVEVDNVFDLWLPQDGTALVVDSVQNEESGEWFYLIRTIDIPTGVEDIKNVPANVTTFLDVGEDNHAFVEWTEKFAVLNGKEYHGDASSLTLGYRNDEEVVKRIQSMIVPPNCVVYVPRGTIVNHPPTADALVPIDPAAEQLATETPGVPEGTPTQ